MASEAQLIAEMTKHGHTEETAKAAIAGRGIEDLSREYLGTGGGSSPSSAEEVTPYLDIYQKNLLNQSTDPALQGLVTQYAPNLQSTLDASTQPQKSGYVLSSKYVGKSLNQINNELQNSGQGGFRADVLANFLKVGENDKLTAEQVFDLSGWNKEYIGTSSEWQGFTKAFEKYQPPAPEPAAGTASLALPEPINRVEQFQELRLEMGVADMESYLTDLKAEEEFLYAELRARTGRERGEPIPLGVIEGRVSTIERQQMERIDLVRRLKATVVDQLNVAYSVITTLINYAGQDYADAVNAYNDEFQRNITIYGLINQSKQQAVEEARYQTGLQIQQIEYTQQIASANLQTMMNAIISGNVNYDDLDDSTKATISKLEAQAGLPQGFSSSLKVNPKDSVLFQTSNEGITQVGFIQPDGTVRVEEYGRRISSGGGGGNLSTEDYKSYLVEDAKNYKNLGELLTLYAEYLSDEEIIRLYDRYSPFNPHTESNRELNQRYGTNLPE